MTPKETVQLVAGWIRDKQPGAVVRFLEGEARVLSASIDRPERLRDARRKLRKQSGVLISDTDVMVIRDKVLLALDQADVVGMIGGDARYNDEHEELLSRTQQLFAERAALRRTPDAYVTPGHVSETIYSRLAVLLEGQVTSVISSRDVATAVTDLGARDVRVFQIPSQSVRRAVDGAFEASLHSTPIWPDFLRDLETQITVREPGEVFLVGGGLFCKHLCIQIRNLGGIAIDLGSQLDRLAMKPTRGRGWRKFLAACDAEAVGSAPSDEPRS